MKDKNLSFRKSLRTYCKTLPCAQWKLCIQEEYSHLQARVNAEYRELCFLPRLCFSLFFSWGQSVVSVYAEYYPSSGDRRWRIQCGIRKPVNICQQSAYFQGKFKFTCPQNSFITGTSMEHLTVPHKFEMESNFKAVFLVETLLSLGPFHWCNHWFALSAHAHV